jgi:hypothetical protein
MDEQNQAPKIHIDSDWKAQARAEKERLTDKGKTEGPAGAAGRGGLPPASFETLVSTMATQALFALGAIPDPRTGQRMMSLDLARHHIDMLSVIEQKSKGNLSADESNLLATTLYELRQRYIQMSSAARGG